jgi:ribonuclease G
VTRALLWDTGPGEIRSGLVENGQLTEFRIIRLRRGETALIQAGERYTVRLNSRLGNGQVIVTLCGDHQALLQNCPPLAEGALLDVEMVRGPIPEPGHWKLPVVRPLDVYAPRHGQPAWHFSAEPWELFLQHHASIVDTIVCRDAQSATEVRSVLKDRAAKIDIDSAQIDEADFESLMDTAVSGSLAIEGGALTIERTRAMTMIDIDGTASPLALNLAAARAIPRLLRLLDIGGPVGIDFVALNNRDERQQIATTLDTAASAVSLGAHERTAVNGYGFCQIIRARTRPSIAEILCGTHIGKLSLESRAIALLRDVGKSKGIGPRQLVAPPAIIDLIRQWPEETGALRFSLGVEIELVPDPTATGYGHVHVRPS